jgi:hypothetical protein
MKYQELFQCLKGVGEFDLSGLSLPVLGTKYTLQPINCQAHKVDNFVVDMLTNARNSNPNSFLTVFTATNDRTKNWLVNSVANDRTRILFVLKETDTGNLYGYMGLAYGDDFGTRIEGDAIVKYSETTQPGLMRKAFVQLVEWVSHGLGVNEIWIRVLSDNPALGFYERCNFACIYKAPLFEVLNLDGEIESLVESSNQTYKLSSRTLTYMKYLP